MRRNSAEKKEAMADRRKLESLFEKHGFTDFRWMEPAAIVVSQWVRMKCMFGCPEYGKAASCPPNTPTVEECRRFFQEYATAAVFHFVKTVDKPEDRHGWTREINRRLIDLEREVFLAGHVRAFMLFMDSCTLCTKCPGTRTECKDPKKARPAPEAMAVDVFTTVLRAGYPIEVLSDYRKAMNRYAFLLVE
jgi:predicted metal-binding protein